MWSCRAWRRRAVDGFAGLVVIVAVLLPAGVALAHDPIVLTDEQRTPTDGPLLLDGTVSWAVYAIVGDRAPQAFRARFEAGDPVDVTLLIPDQPPEVELAEADLPVLTIDRPDGSTATVTPTTRAQFVESFSGDSYVRYAEYEETATEGVYGFTVSGVTPARVTVALGTREEFGTPVENIANRELGIAGVREWFATPPTSTAPAIASTTSLPSTTAPAITNAATTVATTAPESAVASDVPAASDSISERAPDVERSTIDPADSGPDRPGWVLVSIAVAVGLAVGAAALMLVRRRASD